MTGHSPEKRSQLAKLQRRAEKAVEIANQIQQLEDAHSFPPLDKILGSELFAIGKAKLLEQKMAELDALLSVETVGEP